MNKKIIILFQIFILFVSIQYLHAQEAGRRYTFIAKDGSQIINAYLIREEENTYSIRITQDNRTIVIEKKNIAKLIQTDSAVPGEYVPVIGKKSNKVLPEKSDNTASKEKAGSFKKNFYVSLAINTYLISAINEGFDGFGIEVLPLLGFKKTDFFQLGAGFSYNFLSMSVQDKLADDTVYGAFGYLQISNKSAFLSFDYLSLRPFMGIEFGRFFFYALDYYTVPPPGGPFPPPPPEETIYTDKEFNNDPYFGYRLGIGIFSGKEIPTELILYYQYTAVSSDVINNFSKWSIGINYYF